MPTNKMPFTFNLEDEYLRKMKFIAKEETRSLSNLPKHICKLHIVQYEEQHGKIISDKKAD